ncbi:MAG: hypothetical protein ACR5K4_01400 [Sodalis sp. (in: enterobacteria)]
MLPISPPIATMHNTRFTEAERGVALSYSAKTTVADTAHKFDVQEVMLTLNNAAKVVQPDTILELLVVILHSASCIEGM